MKKCSHSICHCMVAHGEGITQKGKAYCSQACANAGEQGSGPCLCGHPDCEGH